MIPQTSPGASYLAHREAIDAAVRRVLESGSFILGEELHAFESEFAAYLGTSHAVGVANGTDAIELALRATGVGPGDVVFTVSHTAVATVAAVERAGAIPVLVDIDPRTLTMDPVSLEQAIRALAAQPGVGKARVVLPVHLYGHPADLEAILEIARRHDLAVIEDCAQAHGGSLDGQKLGTFGVAAAFSFYPTKNLGALGDAGMVVTGDEQVAERARALREYGWRERSVSQLPGMNSRLDELQAAVLRTKLPHLDEENRRRRALADRYSESLVPGKIALPSTRPGCTHAFHLYVVRAESRDELKEFLKTQRIGSSVHYPVPVHLQPAYRDRLPALVPLPVTERAAREVLSLPLFPELSAADLATVIARVNAWSEGPVPAAVRKAEAP